jgi:predicted SAM-dependent methyltransferase
MKTALNVGCGEDVRKSTSKWKWINIDQHKANGADVVHSLPAKLPFKANSIDKVYCSHLLEDFTNWTEIVDDFHRVLKPGGVLHIRVPHARGYAAWSNGYHKREFVCKSIAWAKGKKHYGKVSSFRIVRNRINFFHRGLYKWYGWMDSIVNLSPGVRSLYEISFWSVLFPPFEIEWVLIKNA